MVVTATGERRHQANGEMRRLSNFSEVTPRLPGISSTTALDPFRTFGAAHEIGVPGSLPSAQATQTLSVEPTRHLDQ